MSDFVYTLVMSLSYLSLFSKLQWMNDTQIRAENVLITSYQVESFESKFAFSTATSACVLAAYKL